MDLGPDRLGGPRAALLARLFPEGVPALWCPPLTHFADDGSVDVARQRAHLAALRPWVRGLLVPGSTGEGWELSAAEERAVLSCALDEVRAAGGRLLVGVLRRTAAEAVAGVRDA